MSEVLAGGRWRKEGKELTLCVRLYSEFEATLGYFDLASKTKTNPPSNKKQTTPLNQKPNQIKNPKTKTTPPKTTTEQAVNQMKASLQKAGVVKETMFILEVG